MNPVQRDSARHRVLIVDDNRQVREALSIMISTMPNFDVCGEAATPAEALSLVGDLAPEIAIVDISLKGESGIELIGKLKAKCDQLRVLVWSLHSEQTYEEAALQAGAMGFITKEKAIAHISDALGEISRGRIYSSKGLSG